MKRSIKIYIGVILALLMTVGAPLIQSAVTQEYVMAATLKEPKTTVNKVSLYVGYKNYQIKFSNLDKKATVVYKSSNEKIAKVSKTGTITPVAKGNATIAVTMKQNSKTYTSKIKVTVDIPSVKFTSKTSEVKIGDTFTFKAKVYGTDQKISWSVSDKSIGKIDSKTGIFTALKTGEVDVVAAAGNITSTYTVKVSKVKFATSSTDITIFEQEIIYINTQDMITDEEIIFEIGDTKILNCQWGDWEEDDIALLLDPLKEGSTTVTITSSRTSDQLVLQVNVVEAPEGRDPELKELTAKEIYNKCAPATVELKVTTPEGEYVGSGFFLFSGVLVTNYHVIEGATKIVVITNNKKEYEVDYIYDYDEKYDIAMLSINAVTEHLTLYRGEISVGDTVYALGSPRGLTGSLSNGIVSSPSRIDDGVDYIQVTAPISPGNSGGPLINSYGEVIGINTFILTDSQNLNFALNVYQYAKLDLNAPYPAADFYAENVKNYSSASNSTIIYEDESKSGDISTAQYLPSESAAYGSLDKSNTVDGYKLTLSKAGTVTIVCTTENNLDIENTYISIIDKNNIITDDSITLEKDGAKYRAIVDTVPAGDYWVIIYKSEDNINTTINYLLVAIY